MKKYLIIILMFLSSSIYSQIDNFKTFHINKKFNSEPNNVTVEIKYNNEVLYDTVYTLTTDNYDFENNIFSDELNIDTVEYWTSGQNYNISINNINYDISTVTKTEVAQYFAKTDTTKDYITILHNGDYLYVDKYNKHYNDDISIEFYNDSIYGDTIYNDICKDTIIINNKEIVGHIPNLSEILSLSKQIENFKTTYNDANLNKNYLNLYSNCYYFYKDNDLFKSVNILNMRQNINNDSNNSQVYGFVRCVYSPKDIITN